MIDPHEIRPGMTLGIVVDPDASRASAILGDAQETAMTQAAQMQMEGLVFKVLAVHLPLIAVEYLNGARNVISAHRFTFTQVPDTFAAALKAPRGEPTASNDPLVEYIDRNVRTVVQGQREAAQHIRAINAHLSLPWWRRLFTSYKPHA